MKHVKIIYGTEQYLMEQERQKFVDVCCQSFGQDTDIRVFQGDAVPAGVVEAFESTSLFGAGGVCIWNESPFLPVKRGGRSRGTLGKDEAWFLDKIADIAEHQAVLFYTKGNIDTGCIFYKKIKGMADVVKCDPVTDRNVMPYVAEYLAAGGKKMTAAADHYLRGLFQTWDSIPLLYVFSELEKLCITLPDTQVNVDVSDLGNLFSGTVEKNLFAFMDAFLQRDGKTVVPFLQGLFSRQDLFLKNTGYMMSRLRLLKAYKELRGSRMGRSQCESILSQVNKGRSVKYVLFHLQKVESHWTMTELNELITKIFKLQLNIRRGTCSSDDMASLICLYCSEKGRHA